MKKTGTLVILTTIVVFLSTALISCLSAGRKFPVEPVSKIVIGQTTREDIQRMFGDPWSAGIENGMKTWTYGDYHHSLFKEASRTDLVIRFNQDGTVLSYSFNTTDPEYINK